MGVVSQSTPLPFPSPREENWKPALRVTVVSDSGKCSYDFSFVFRMRKKWESHCSSAYLLPLMQLKIMLACFRSWMTLLESHQAYCWLKSCLFPRFCCLARSLPQKPNWGPLSLLNFIILLQCAEIILPPHSAIQFVPYKHRNCICLILFYCYISCIHDNFFFTYSEVHL